MQNPLLRRAKALSVVKLSENSAEISLPVHPAIFSRAAIIALKNLGIEKDWEKVHIDAVYALTEKENGTKINLPKNLCAVKEYDKIVIYSQKKN